MIEQPLADDGMSLVNHADLQKRIETPVCLDESALSLAHVQRGHPTRSCKVVTSRWPRVGGLTASRDIQALCAEQGIPCGSAGMLESAIARHLRRARHPPNFTYPGDIFPSVVLLQVRNRKPEIVLSGRGEGRHLARAGIAQSPPRSAQAMDSGARFPSASRRPGVALPLVGRRH